MGRRGGRWRRRGSAPASVYSPSRGRRAQLPVYRAPVRPGPARVSQPFLRRAGAPTPACPARDRRNEVTDPSDEPTSIAAMDVTALRDEALAAITAAADLAALDEARIAFLGRKSPLKQALRDVRDRESGMALNEARVAVETALDERQHALESAELERSLRDERVDVTLPGERPARGHYHLITQIRREVEDLFLGLGYEVYDAPEVDTVWHNFE